MPRRPDNIVDPTHVGSPSFPTTAWSQILVAQGRDRKIAASALGRLIERYWHPVYFFLRHKGRNREEAKDLTQEFFTSFLEKDIIAYADEERGRFRSFLLTSVCRFLALKQRSAARRPRDVELPEFGVEPDERLSLEPSASRTPEEIFMRDWARCFLDSCVAKLREECERLDREMHFRVFQLRFLNEKPPSGREIASRLGISETDVTNYLHRAKQRFRGIATKEMLNWVASPDEIRDEIGSLLELL